MRFLADENIPADAVTELVRLGHDVVWVRDAAPASHDQDILALAMREDRVLLTFDQDFGELAWRAGLPASCGVVLFRLPMPAASEVGRLIVRIVTERTDWGGNFSVVEPGRIRMRALTAR